MTIKASLTAPQTVCYTGFAASQCGNSRIMVYYTNFSSGTKRNRRKKTQLWRWLFCGFRLWECGKQSTHHRLQCSSWRIKPCFSVHSLMEKSGHFYATKTPEHVRLSSSSSSTLRIWDLLLLFMQDQTALQEGLKVWSGSWIYDHKYVSMRNYLIVDKLPCFCQTFCTLWVGHLLWVA